MPKNFKSESKSQLKSQSKLGWNFDNSYLNLSRKLYTKINPVSVKNPRLIIINQNLAKFLNLNLKNANEENLAKIFSGNILPENSEPIAQAYAGHQFGHFVMLGDGRALLLGEQITKKGSRFDIQLKGSGQTPYSRSGDGRAALGPMLREYIISEAMYGLKIPTTRSLAVVTTGESVFRQEILPGAILTRVAKSHIRVGTFQYCAALNDKKILKKLADYAIKRHYSKITQDKNPYLSLLKSVIKKQINLVCHWMRVGFIHGVINTDNVTISGETIDYGPCAFMNKYDPATVFSSIDHRGRYAFGNQGMITKWNMIRFAEALLPLIDKDEKKAIELAQSIISSFDDLFENEWLNMMRKKLGLIGKKTGDEKLISSLLKIMQNEKLDYTNTFANLTKIITENSANFKSLEKNKAFLPKNCTNFLEQEWLEKWQNRLSQNGKPFSHSLKIMKNSNPVIIPRNNLVEAALKDAQDGNLETLTKFLHVLTKPYDDNIDDFYKKTEEEDGFYKTFCGT